MDKVYVLHGHWETIDDRGVIIVKVSFDEDELIKMLGEIAENKAKEYCDINERKLVIDHSETDFEMRDCEDGGFAGFYITEHNVELPR